MGDNDSGVLWEGQPYDGIFLRPGDIFWAFITLAFGSAILVYVLSREFSLVIIPFIAMMLYLAFGRLWHDAYLRRDIRYVLRKGALEVSGIRTNRLIRSVPIVELADVRPLWSGDIASIELPVVPQDIFTDIYDGRQRAVPALRPHRRLELIQGAPEVAKLMRSLAIQRIANQASSPDDPSLALL